jgi:murein DD-endopeptidase MepM/ murein hydrolase activator NlpD
MAPTNGDCSHDDVAQVRYRRSRSERPGTGVPGPAGWSNPIGKRTRRVRRHLPALLLMIPLVVGLLGAPVGTSVVSGDELSDAKAKQAQLKKKVAEQKAEVAELASLQAGLAGEIRQTKAQLNGINADLVAVRKNITKMQTKVAAVKKAYEALVVEVKSMDAELVRVTTAEKVKRQELSERRALLADRVRNAYDTNRTSPLETFLSGGTFTDLLAEMSYYIDVGEQDQALANQIADDKETLASLHQTVADTRERTNEVRQETAAQKRVLDRQLVELKDARAKLKKLEAETARELRKQKSTYARVARNKVAARQAMAAAAAAQRKLASKIDALIRDQAASGRIPSKYNGTLAWPMSGNVTQTFGCTGFSWEPPLGSCAHFHKGIDVAAPMYTPVKASGAGTVVFAGANPYDPQPQAWIVIVAHSATLNTWYAHLDNAVHPIKVSVGQHVSKGQVIAYNGMTGRSTGPHLHWMVERGGTFVNPRLYL